MAWFSDLKLFKNIKDNKAEYSLTAKIDGEVTNVSVYDVQRFVRDKLVEQVAYDLKQKFVDELVNQISMQDVRDQALLAFKDDIRKNLMNRGGGYSERY